MIRQTRGTRELQRCRVFQYFKTCHKLARNCVLTGTVSAGHDGTHLQFQHWTARGRGLRIWGQHGLQTETLFPQRGGKKIWKLVRRIHHSLAFIGRIRTGLRRTPGILLRQKKDRTAQMTGTRKGSVLPDSSLFLSPHSSLPLKHPQ